MTLANFLQLFYCRVDIQNQGNVTLVITTVAIRRADNRIVDRVRTSIDIQETTDWLIDSNAPSSITPWNWNKLIDQAKRGHLDYFAQRAPIENFYPLNDLENPDISMMYI